MEDLLSDGQQKSIPNKLELLASLQSEDYIHLYADWTRTKGSVPQFHEEILGLDHMDPLKSQEGKEHATVYQSSSLQRNNFHNIARFNLEPTIDQPQVKKNTTQVQTQTPQRVQNERC